MTRLDKDTREVSTGDPYEVLEGDHITLVRVLKLARHDGLTLENDADAIATMILRSGALTGRGNEQLRVDAAALIEEAEAHERTAKDSFRDLNAAAHSEEQAHELLMRAATHARRANDARARSAALLEGIH